MDPPGGLEKCLVLQGHGVNPTQGHNNAELFRVDLDLGFPDFHISDS